MTNLQSCPVSQLETNKCLLIFDFTWNNDGNPSDDAMHCDGRIEWNVAMENCLTEGGNKVTAHGHQ